MNDDKQEPTGTIIVGRFGPGSGETEIVNPWEKCRHIQYELDAKARAVTCIACGSSVDAFQVLMEYAERERHWMFWDAKARDAEKRTRAAQEAEKKAKARTRAHNRKDAEIAVADERKRIADRLSHVTWDLRGIVETAQKIERAIGANRKAIHGLVGAEPDMPTSNEIDEAFGEPRS